MDALDRQLIQILQDGMPICERPLQPTAQRLGISETEILHRIAALLEDGVLTRYGPLFDAAAMGGAFSLCAMRVPAETFDTVAEAVNAHPEVAHNYEREHAWNLWFVLGTEDPARVEEVLGEIEAETGCEVLNLPKLEEFYVGLRLELAP